MYIKGSRKDGTWMSWAGRRYRVTLPHRRLFKGRNGFEFAPNLQKNWEKGSTRKRGGNSQFSINGEHPILFTFHPKGLESRTSVENHTQSERSWARGESTKGRTGREGSKPSA